MLQQRYNMWMKSIQTLPKYVSLETALIYIWISSSSEAT